MRRTAMALLGAVSIVCCCLQTAGANPSVKIAVLTDMSSVYADYGGAGSILAAKMAIAVREMTDLVEVLSADTQNKAEIGLAIAQQWFDQGVGAIFDVPNS